jgi:DNA-binding HxlR family transcriptional regulator
MRQTSFASMQCSLARGLDLMGDWWSPLILRDLFFGISRFDELVEDLGISRNLLTRRLKTLEEKGIIERVPYALKPLRFSYHLAPAGRDLVPILIALTDWGDRWVQPKEGAPVFFKHKTCGHQFRPNIVCAECSEVFACDEVEALAGPGGRAKTGTKLVARKLHPAGDRTP